MRRTTYFLAVSGLILALAIALIDNSQRASAQDGAGVTVFPGGNYVTYLGESRPIEETLAVPRGEITAVYRFDGRAQRWQAWASALPAALQQVTELVSGLAYWLNYEGAGAVFWAFEGEADPVAAIDIVSGWNSFGCATLAVLEQPAAGGADSAH